MKMLIAAAGTLMALAMPVTSHAMAEAEGNAPTQAEASLFNTISELDTAVFDAFNNCTSPEQLQKHASYFDSDVEFYHDNAGVTWNRRDMIANVEKNVCGNYRRELIAGTLKVYPIRDFGAIATGAHRFCQIKTGSCEGMADFAIVWRNADNKWQITRVLSFGHRPIEASKP
jgi:hypothetical protein